MVNNTTTIDSLTGLVVFVLGGREYCADIKDILAIINPNELKGPADLKSDKPSVTINNFRIPLINLHSYYGLELRGSSEDRRILTVENGNNIFGFIVDRVKEIITMNRDFKEKLEFKPSNKDPYLIGVLNYEGRALYLPDFNNLFQSLKDSINE